LDAIDTGHHAEGKVASFGKDVLMGMSDGRPGSRRSLKRQGPECSEL
jgi:hypothetical protein